MFCFFLAERLGAEDPIALYNSMPLPVLLHWQEYYKLQNAE